MIVFFKSNPPAIPEKIARAPQAIGHDLPDAYMAFLQAQNGGRPESNICDLPEARQWGIGITEFYGIGQSPDLLERQEHYRERVPENLLAIADAEGGNLICIALAGDHRGVIFFWDHENESQDGERPGYQNIHQIASDFDSFLVALKPLSDEPLPSQVHEAWIDPDLLAEIAQQR